MSQQCAQIFSHQQPASFDLKYNMCRRFLWINVATSISIQESKDFFHLLSRQSTCEGWNQVSTCKTLCVCIAVVPPDEWSALVRHWQHLLGCPRSHQERHSSVQQMKIYLMQLSVSRGLSNSECQAWYKHGHHKTVLLNAQAVWNESKVLLNVWMDVLYMCKTNEANHTSEEIAHK